MRAQMVEWTGTLDQLRALFLALHEASEAEYKKGLQALSQSSDSLTDLSERVTRSVELMPNPGARLQQLWAGLDQLERQLGSSLVSATSQLSLLGTASEGAAGGLDQLGRNAGAAAVDVRAGGMHIRSELTSELNQISVALRRLEYAGVGGKSARRQ